MRTNALAGVRHALGISLARWQFRRSHDEMMSFSGAISSAQRILLIMPLEEEDLLPTVRVLEMVRTRFKGENITVVTGTRGVEAIRLLPHSKFIHLLEPQVSPLFIPHADFLINLHQQRYELAIDLNLDLVLPSGYICKVSGAKVRVGFCRNSADLFYNFQVRPDRTLGKKFIYDRFVQCLEKF